MTWYRTIDWRGLEGGMWFSLVPWTWELGFAIANYHVSVALVVVGFDLWW